MLARVALQSRTHRMSDYDFKSKSFLSDRNADFSTVEMCRCSHEMTLDPVTVPNVWLV